MGAVFVLRGSEKPGDSVAGFFRFSLLCSIIT